MKKYKHIAIFCNIDDYANYIRPIELKKFLEKKGHKVTLINNESIYTANKKKKHTENNRFYTLLHKNALNLFENYVTGWTYYLYFLLKQQKRVHAIKKIIVKNRFDLLIFENHINAYVAKNLSNIPYILDLDSPYIDELYITGKLNQNAYSKIINEYKKIYKKAKYINFQWHLYADYIKKNVYNGKNFVEVNFGCNVKNKSLRAKYKNKPKIIFLGYLGGKWVNLPLLSKLSKLYDIDVYGGPEPEKKWGLNYKGYAQNTNILKNYQFGLITISNDKLRQSSFSSKHLEYISYGLPVLTPEWRQDIILKDVSIYYNEENFLDTIKKYSNKNNWQKLSDRSYKKAKELQWTYVLKPLEDIINKT